ncbi:MAG: hypothetical protein PXZ08_11025 [Actinomycetota bacterium]|nr:hypothetical protein [Actinomycetota bacterium]
MSPHVGAESQLSDEEMAAVAIAIEMLTSSPPSPSAFEDSPDVTPAWRFSGRCFEPGRRRS